MDYLGNFFGLSAGDIIKYFLISGSFYIVYYIILKKSLMSAKIQKKEVSAKEIREEIYHSLLSSITMTFLFFIMLYTPISAYTLLYDNISEYSLLWLIISIPIGMMIHDTYFYWLHRLLHHKNIFGYTHFIHHRSNNPSPFTSYSFHILEAVGEGLIVPILLLIIPLHPIAVYIFLLLSFIINVYGHLGYEIAPRWFRTSFLFNILNTSVYHNLHHSNFQGNYGLYFRFWDKLIGTENPKYTDLYDEIQNSRFNN